MREIAQALRAEVDAALPRLRALSEADATADRGRGRWVKKEILGHLIDSAFNNDQRFVRAPLADRFVGPGYDQDAWVHAHQYRARAWSDLIVLWAAANRHLAFVIEGVPAERLSTPCAVGNREETLQWWMTDYGVHLRHHLEQLFED